MIDNDSIELNETLLKHYGSLAGWTKEEAIALLGNLNPRCKKETLNIIKIAGDDILPMESLNRAIACGEISCVDGLIKPLEFVNWCKLKDLNFSPTLEVFVRIYHKSEYIDWEAKYKELEVADNKKIQNLQEEFDELQRQSLPLHGGERNGWVKLVTGMLSAGYQHLLHKNIDELVSVIHEDLEQVENNIEINICQITLDKKTLKEKFTFVQKYCKKHPKTPH